jgi:hypothetical protein
MKRSWTLIILLFFLMSCNQNNNKTLQQGSVTTKIKRQITDIATDYITSKFNNSDKSVGKDGILNIVNGQRKFVIDPLKISVGLIDSDEVEDATLTIPSYNGQYDVTTELLVMLKSDNKFRIVKVLEGDMKVLKIEDRIIYIEIPKLPPDSPNYNCAICREVVKYKYLKGDLIKAE